MTGLFTLDTILAITVAFSMITASYLLLAGQKIDNREHLFQTSADILTIAEKNGRLSRAIDGDKSGINEYKGLLSSGVCFSLDIENTSGSIISHDDTGCDMPDSYAIARRTVYHNRQFYISTLRVWYR
ncbi:MAG: hypothetical protein V1921_04195 [Candidatus Altiarchaeota archaeon]